MSSDPPTTAVRVATSTNIRAEVYDTDEQALGDATPRRVAETSNVTCVGLHEYIPVLLNHRNDVADLVDPTTAIAFGNDASQFSASDRELNSRVGAIDLTDPANDGTTWSCSELLGQLELNGLNIRELGVETAAGVLWNHAPMPTPLTPKTSDDAVLLDVTITIGAP